jgi:hypothetical protein
MSFAAAGFVRDTALRPALWRQRVSAWAVPWGNSVSENVFVAPLRQAGVHGDDDSVQTWGKSGHLCVSRARVGRWWRA